MNQLMDTVFKAVKVITACAVKRRVHLSLLEVAAREHSEVMYMMFCVDFLFVVSAKITYESRTKILKNCIVNCG
jgi:hypothetical protein